MKKNFVRVKESFVCENCGAEVAGNGYTNHCPKCLYSKHVDKDIPGDRLSECGGLMEPTGIEDAKGKRQIVFRCRKCGQENKNKVSDLDSADEIIRVSSLRK